MEFIISGLLVFIKIKTVIHCFKKKKLLMFEKNFFQGLDYNFIKY